MTSASFTPFCASAPGKIILSGEHSVVHGSHAVATVIGKRTYATFSPLGAEGTSSGVETKDGAAQASNANKLILEIDYRGKTSEYSWDIESIRECITRTENKLPSVSLPPSLASASSSSSSASSSSSSSSCSASFSTSPTSSSSAPLDCEGKLKQRKKWSTTLSTSVSFLQQFAEELKATTADKGASLITMSDVSNLVFVALYGTLVQGHVGVRCRVTSDLPMGAGLGSSASYCTVLSAGFWHLHNELERLSTTRRLSPRSVGPLSLSSGDLDVVNAYAYQGERLIHGNPSGVDNTCSVYGGVVVYRKGHDTMFLPKLPPVKLLVTDTCVSRNTKALVAGVGKIKDLYPEVAQNVFNAIDGIALKLIEAIKQNSDNSSSSSQSVDAFVTACEMLFPVNQGLLESVGTGHPKITTVIQAAKDVGFVSKLTGAGGGGCVITLLTSKFCTSPAASDALRAKLESMDFKCIEAVVGQDGVIIDIHDSKGTDGLQH